MGVSVISYADADEHIKDRIEKEWRAKAAGHMHLSDGYPLSPYITACWSH